MPVIPATWEILIRHEDQKFMAGLGNLAGLYLKYLKIKHTNGWRCSVQSVVPPKKKEKTKTKTKQQQKNKVGYN